MNSRRPRAALSAALAVIVTGACPLTAASDPVISGILQTRLDAAWQDGAAEDYTVGLEEYASLRLKAAAGDRGTVYAAVNLVAASGSCASDGLAGNSLIAGDNYAAAIEVERLYAKIQGRTTDVEGGLLRIPFGYGQAFRPTDFLNPPNPLLPDARPRAVLGGTLALYPADTSKLRAFAAMGTDPGTSDGGGASFGLSGDINTERLSSQALYAYQAPSSTAPDGIHRGGFSAKLEAGAAFVADVMYSWDGGELVGFGGLRASMGIDYSVLGGDLYLLGQYLYNGPRLLERGTLPRTNYLYGLILYRFDDYTSATLSALAGLDDESCAPSMGVERELFQGCTAGMSFRMAFDSWNPSSASAALTVRMRF